MRVAFALLLGLAFGCSKKAPTEAGAPPNAAGDKKEVPTPTKTNDKPKNSEKDSGKKGFRHTRSQTSQLQLGILVKS